MSKVDSFRKARQIFPVTQQNVYFGSGQPSWVSLALARPEQRGKSIDGAGLPAVE